MADDDYSGYQNPPSEYADAQNPPSAYANKGGTAPPAAKPKALKSPGKTGEVTIPAVFVWHPPIDEKTEVDLLLNGSPARHWHPTTADYTAITGVTLNPGPADFVALMGIIAEYQPKSIKRLNFWTHSNKNVIGITGIAKPDDIYFERPDGTQAGCQVNATEIAGFAASGMSFKFNGVDFTLDDVRGRFADDALFVLYGCDIAFDPTTLLTALRDLFRVSVVGFKYEMVFCPPQQTSGSATFIRKGEKVGIKKPGFNCDVDSTADWRSLASDPNAVKVSK
jgi:hypothetical protein